MGGRERALEKMVMDLSFWKGKRIFLTGHTGFKGAWLCRVLALLSSDVCGYALEPPTVPSLFDISGAKSNMRSVIGDIRDLDSLRKAFREHSPEIVIHMAAQPLVRASYSEPEYTYATNVMGTVNILECLRLDGSAKSFLNVTTDKVYRNNEWEWGYRENDRLDGFDPYSNSKSCSELVTHCYTRSFFADGATAISTARAGNVIGGGDFSKDRIIPDCIRAAEKGEPIAVRNPHAVRPYQHVLEPLFAYLMIAKKQYGDKRFAGWYNVGPDEDGYVTTGCLVDIFCRCWGNKLKWEQAYSGGPHEAGLLKLDCARLKSVFGWKPRWDIHEAISKTVEWTKGHIDGEDVKQIMDRQIEDYFEKCANSL